MGLFIRKPFEALQAEANASGKKTLKRVLGPWSLVALGVGVIIGAGLFSITGTVAAGYTGPAITLSFAIAALGCCFAGLCYAEFASMIPVAGSAYTYSYATMGELIAWIIGWDLVLEYTVAATTVSISWSRYLVVFLEGLDIHLPQALTACPWDGGVVNIPAFLIVVLMSLFLIRGTEGSSIFNGFIVFLKVSVILIFVILGWKYINTDNYTPYIPANTGVLGEYGFSGILRGAAIVFFAFLGFDAVSTAAQETKNPKRNMPIGILVSLLVCTVLYMVFAHVMTGVAHYTAFSGQQGIAPVAIAIEHMGQAVHSVRILLRHHGDTAGTEPRIPKHEPRRAAASFLLAYQRKVPYSGTQQPALHGTCGPAGSFCTRTAGRRDDKHRHADGLHAGLCRCTGSTQNHA